MSLAAWLLFGALALAAVAVLALAALRGARRGSAGARAAFDLQIYRDQLAELDADRARGAITPEEAKAARTEIERRILSASGPAGADRPARGARAGRRRPSSPWRCRR